MTIAGKPISIAASIAEAGRTLSANLLPFAKTAAIPLALWLVLPPAATAAAPYGRAALEWACGYWSGSTPLWLLLATTIEFLATAIPLMLFCCHWLHYLLRPASSAKAVVFWTKQDWCFLRYGLLLFTLQLLFKLAALLFLYSAIFYSAIFSLGFYRIALENGLLIFVAGILSAVLIDAWIVGRSAPIFAAAVDGSPRTLRSVWAVTRGQSLRLMLLVVLLARVPFLAAYLLQGQLDQSFGSIGGSSVFLWRLLQLPSGVLQCVGLALVASLSLRLYVDNCRGPEATLLEQFD